MPARRDATYTRVLARVCVVLEVVIVEKPPPHPLSWGLQHRWRHCLAVTWFSFAVCSDLLSPVAWSVKVVMFLPTDLLLLGIQDWCFCCFCVQICCLLLLGLHNWILLFLCADLLSPVAWLTWLMFLLFLLFLCADLLSPVAWFTRLSCAVSTVSVCRTVVSCYLVYTTELWCFCCFCVQICCLLLLGLHNWILLFLCADLLSPVAWFMTSMLMAYLTLNANLNVHQGKGTTYPRQTMHQLSSWAASQSYTATASAL